MISPMLVPNIKPKNRNPENRGSNGKVHQVLHNDVAGVLGTGKPGFHHSKSSLHENTSATHTRIQMVSTDDNMEKSSL